VFSVNRSKAGALRVLSQEIREEIFEYQVWE